MPIEQFFDIGVYAINEAKKRQGENDTCEHVNNVTNPTSIKSGGWF